MNDGFHGQGTHSSKTGAASLAKNTPNLLKKIGRSSQLAQKFRILLKKGFIGCL
jgi:hypothetical protein